MTYGLTQHQFWSCYLIQMRPYLFFVSGIAVLAGIASSTNSETTVVINIIVAIAGFFGYGFGQALTDVTQTDTDALSAPYRPLSGNIIRKDSVMLVSVLGLVSVACVFVYANLWNILFTIAMVVGLTTYTVFKRRWWWGGPIWNSWIVALLPIVGALSASGASPSQTVNCSVFHLSVATAVSYASFVVIGYLKDITADRATGYNTLPVVCGWKSTAVVGDILQGVAAILYALIIATGHTMAWWVWIVGSGIALHGQVTLPRSGATQEPDAIVAIAATVRSFVWWNVAVVVALQPQWWWLGLVFIVGLEATLLKRPSTQQI